MAEIGETLREARMRSRIDITEVERRTKIRARYLRAIENEEWDLLPGPIYAKSFLRTYGDFLGVDSRMLVDEFRRRYERPTEHDVRPLGTLTRERERIQRGPLVPPWAIVAGVLVLVLVALYLLGRGSSPHPATPRVAVPTHNPTPTGTGRRRPRHRGVPAPPGVVALSIVPTGTVYVCLVDGTGHKLINEQTLSAGAAVPVQKAPKLLLTLGNNAVTLKVNGRALPVAASAQAIRLLLTPTSVRPIPLSTSPTCP